MSVFDKDRLNRDFCPVNNAVKIIGDKWTLLILRECFFGFKRFEDFQKNLNISRSVLTKKLSLMVSSGILSKTEYKQKNRRGRFNYELTAKGSGLFKVIVSIYNWGEAQCMPGGAVPAYRLTSKHSGSAVKVVLSDDLNTNLKRNEIRIKLACTRR